MSMMRQFLMLRAREAVVHGYLTVNCVTNRCNICDKVGPTTMQACIRSRKTPDCNLITISLLIEVIRSCEVRDVTALISLTKK